MPKTQHGRKPVHPISVDRQSKRQRGMRMITISVALVIITAAGGAGVWSYYNYQVKPYNQAAIRVNDVTFDMRYYINTLKLYYGNAPAGTSISEFADYGEQLIEQNETIRQGSQALGVQIERRDIEAELAKSGTPVTRERVDTLMAQELVTKQVPATQPQVHVQAMLLESETAAQLAMTRLQAGETFDKLANELSRIPVDTINNGDLGWVTARQADLVVTSTKFGDMVFGTNAGVLSGPVYDDTVSKQFGYWVAKVVEKTDASDNTTTAEAHIQGILVGREQEAKDVMDKLNAGADMNELAKQLSQQPGAKDNGDELGWITESQDTSLFDALFDLPLNTIVGPISDNQTETKGGYWVFDVLEKNDNLALTTDQKNLLENDLLERCMTELQKNPDYKVENLLTQEMKGFALNEVVAAQGEGSVLIGTNSLPAGEAGIAYSQKLEVYGSSRSNTWSIIEGSLPQGLSMDSSTGLISGVPKFAGVSSLTVEVNNGLHYSRQNYVIRVHLQVSVSTSFLPDGQVGVYYSATIEILGDSDIYTWSIISGTLPEGLTLSQYTGYVYGTPTTAGTYNFTIQVDDGLGKATQTISLQVQ